MNLGRGTGVSISEMRRHRVVATLLMSTVLFGACGSGDGDEAAESTTRPPSVADPGTVSGSCVEQYSIESLKERDYAFDGTVRSVDTGTEPDPDTVTFEVHHWYKGGSGDEAVRRASGFGAVTSAGGSPHSVGDRLLVAGDDDFVWECGFTQHYNEEVAEDWDRAF